VLFYPLVKTFTYVTRLIFPSQKRKEGVSHLLSEEEIKLLFTTGVKGMSSLRRKMISEVLNIGSRPIREIMVPRPEIKAIEIGSAFAEILETVRVTEFSRFPVYRDRLDNIEGIFHVKDVIPYLIDKKDINLSEVVRKPVFVPESASLEKVMLQMQTSANHLVFVVDEFGNMEGIVTLEDIIEELVGEIQDEHDAPPLEDLVAQIGKNLYAVKGSAPIKDVNQQIPLDLPESGEYTTAAGFFLAEFGRIPQLNDSLEFNGHRFIIKEMGKRRINTMYVILKTDKDE
jgi:putative hemolysin